MVGGRPVSDFISKHFKQVERVQNNSRRSYFECNFCSSKLEHRDNRLAKHIMETSGCPTASSSARSEARTVLIAKGFRVISPAAAALVPLDAPSDTATVIGVPAHVMKKRKSNGTLDGYVDQPLSAGSKELADIMLFRYVLIKYIFILTYL